MSSMVYSDYKDWYWSQTANAISYQTNRNMTCLNPSLECLMNPLEAGACAYEVRGSFPCLFSMSPMSHYHLLIQLIILCLCCDRTHAWQMNHTWTGHIRCNLIETDGWSGRPVCMIHTAALFVKIVTSSNNASTLIWGTHKTVWHVCCQELFRQLQWLRL